MRILPAQLQMPCDCFLQSSSLPCMLWLHSFRLSVCHLLLFSQQAWLLPLVCALASSAVHSSSRVDTHPSHRVEQASVISTGRNLICLSGVLGTPAALSAAEPSPLMALWPHVSRLLVMHCQVNRNMARPMIYILKAPATMPGRCVACSA